MTPADITALIIAFVAAAGSFIVPFTLARYTARKEASKKVADDRAADHNTDAVSWREFNAAMREERDSLKRQLTDNEERYKRDTETAKAKADTEIARLNSKIEDLQQQIVRLSWMLTRNSDGGGTSGPRDTS